MSELLGPFYRIALRFVSRRQLHQSKIRVIVPVYVDQSDSHSVLVFASAPSDPGEQRGVGHGFTNLA